MKKLTTLITTIAIAFTIFSFAACKKNDTSISYKKNYEFAEISLMGFSGTRNDVLAYLESDDAIEDTNIFKGYFEIATRIEVSFEDESTGLFRIKNFATITGLEESSSLEQEKTNLEKFYDSLKSANAILDDGTVEFKFDYTKTKDKLTIGTIHTGVSSFGESGNGDLSFVEALELLANPTEESDSITYPHKEYKISIENSDAANVATVKNGKIEISVNVKISNFSQESADSDKIETIDAITEIKFIFAK